MNNKKNIKALAIISTVLTLSAAPIAAEASTLYLNFSSSANNASGNINGVSFSGASWALEYAIDTSVADSNSGSESGHYTGAITGGNFSLNGNSYTLANGSDTGNLYLNSYSTAYDGVSINPSSGNYVQFITDYGTVFPQLFSDVNSLSSANVGASVSDTTTDPYNNQSIINYQAYEDWFGNGELTGGVFTSTGDVISIYENSGAASGNFTVSLSATSAFTGGDVSAVPVPAAVWLFASGLVGLIGVARSKRA